jgi:hypothetical protein
MTREGGFVMKRQDKFVAVDCSRQPWAAGSRPPEPGAPSLRYCTVFPGGGGFPQVHLTEYEPHHEEPRHRHPEDEVLTIFEGEIEVEGQVHKAPSVLYVGRGTLYGPLKAGAAGAKFFRVAWNETLLAEPA